LFHGFAHTADGDYDALIADFGERWVTDTLAFKPYPCGTMAQPYIDCARRLATRGIKAEDISEIVCEVAEGTVHRLWNRSRQAAPAQWLCSQIRGAVPAGGRFCPRRGWSRRLHRKRDPRSARTCVGRKVKFVIDPNNPYPNNYTGHIHATLGMAA